MAYKYIEPKEKTYAKAYLVFSGELTSTEIKNGKTFNIHDMFPEVDYEALTSDEFVGGFKSDSNKEGTHKEVTRDWYDGSVGCSMYTNAFSLILSYTPSTGSLTIRPSTQYCAHAKIPNERGGTTSDDIAFNKLNVQVLMIVDGVKSQYVKEN